MSDTERSTPLRHDAPNVLGLDHIELCVGNARHAAHYFQTAYGLEPFAYAGPETGARDRVAVALAQGSIRVVVASPLEARGPLAAFLAAHGDGVRDVALRCRDARAAFERAVENGAEAVAPPASAEDAGGEVVRASIRAFGDTLHTFVEREAYRGAFLPSFAPKASARPTAPTGLEAIDHLAIAVEPGEIDRWVDFYANTLGLGLSQQEEVYSDFSGMSTKVVREDASGVVFVLVEPTPSARRSPIDEFLRYNGGAGVHHIAVASSDILRSVAALRANGVEFASTPDAYFDALAERVGAIGYATDDLRRLSVLVDRDEWGHLLQIFAKPAQPRPTYFFEVIERVEARGFGNGNIKALYEAIEREQAARGNA